MNFTIRKATRADSQPFLALLVSLARFEKLKPPNRVARHRLLEDVFKKKRLGLFVASLEGQVIGYALYFYTYSSFLARPSLYLEDIFVKEEQRGKGIGNALFHRCVREALAKGCGRMEWAVLTWNKDAIGFYEGVGARRLDNWHFYRLDENQFRGIVSDEGRS